MNLTHTGSSHSGEGTVPLVIHQVNQKDKSNIHYSIDIKTYSEDAQEFDDDKSQKIIIKWFYFLYYNEGLIYNLNTENRFHIHDTDTPIDDNSITNAITKTITHLRGKIKERKEEYTAILELQEVSAETISQVHQLIKEELLRLHEASQT